MKYFKFAVIFVIFFKLTMNLYSDKVIIPLKKKKDFDAKFFLKSPIDDNRLWAINRKGIAYDIDVDNDIWTKLDFSIKYNQFEINKIIVQDNYKKKLMWIIGNSNDITLLDGTTKPIKRFTLSKFLNEYAKINVIKPDKKVIWIGTSEGLFYIRRKSFKIEKVEQITSEIRTIYFNKDRHLILNYKLEYTPFSKEIKEILLYRGDISFYIPYIKETDSQILLFNTGRTINWVLKYKNKNEYQLPHLNNYSFDPILDDYKIYYTYRKNLYIYNLKTSKSKTIKLSEDLTQMTMDDKYIWLKDKVGFIRIDKKTLEIKRTVMELFSRMRLSSIYSLKDYLCVRANGVHISKIKKSYIDSKLLPLNSLNVDLKYLENKIIEESQRGYLLAFIKSCLKYIRLQKNEEERARMRMFLASLFDENDFSHDNIDSLERALKYSQNEKEKEVIYYYLYRSYSSTYFGNDTLFDVYKALKYYRKLKQINPHSVFLDTRYLNNDINNLLNYKTKLDSINSLDILEPHKLLLRAKAFKETMNSDLNKSFYNEILKKYPNSDVADNAQYELLGIDFELSQEGEPEGQTQLIKRYESFIKNYPNSELIPNALFKISTLCFMDATLAGIKRYGDPLPVGERLLFKAKAAAEKVLNKYPNFDEMEDLKQFLAEINEVEHKSWWNVKISSDKDNYQIGEAININFNLQNDLNKKRTLNLFNKDDYPNVRIIVCYTESKLNNRLSPLDCYDCYLNVKDIEVDKNRTKRVFKANEIYTESWDITKQDQSFFVNCCDYNSYKYDENHNKIYYRFITDFQKEGYYYIRAFFSFGNGWLSNPSNQICVPVKKKE